MKPWRIIVITPYTEGNRPHTLVRFDRGGATVSISFWRGTDPEPLAYTIASGWVSYDKIREYIDI